VDVNFGSVVIASLFTPQGHVLIASAPRDNCGDGAVYLFSLSNWVTTNQPTILVRIGSQSTGENFGIGMSLSGDGSMLAIGADLYNPGSQPQKGAVYVYNLVTLTFETRVDAPGYLNAVQRFGYTVALNYNANILAVGQPACNYFLDTISTENTAYSPATNGRVHIYTRIGPRPFTWKRRWLKLTQSSATIINLAEISVTSGGTNIALWKPAFASNVFSGDFLPQNLVDGNTGNFYSSSGEAGSWVAIDLGNVSSTITNILITNRESCCQERAAGISVQLLEGTWSNVVWSTTISGTAATYSYSPNV
jgi:hypothetical protein